MGVAPEGCHFCHFIKKGIFVKTPKRNQKTKNDTTTKAPEVAADTYTTK